MSATPASSVHFLVVKRDPMLASSQQNCVFPLCVSGCNPAAFARLISSGDGPDLSVPGAEAGVAAAVVEEAAAFGVFASGAALEGGVGLEVGALEAGPALEVGAAFGDVEDCCAKAGRAAISTAPIRTERIGRFTM